jgi:hypothetical protein
VSDNGAVGIELGVPFDDAPVRIVSSTMADNGGYALNTLCESGGGKAACEPGSRRYELDHVILAGNNHGGMQCGSDATIVSLGNNIASDASCNLTQSTDLPNTDPLLGPLADNGGPTLTHLPLAGSPAIDAIPPADCTWDDDGDQGTPEVPIATDQRGVARPQGAGCDIGAVEVIPEPEPVLLGMACVLALATIRRCCSS